VMTCSPFWSTNVSGCNTTFVGVFPNINNVLRQCFHFYSNDGTFVTYESNVQITSVLNGVTLRNVSNTTTYVTASKIRLRFPINVNVTMNGSIATYGPPIIYGNVISQNFNVASFATTVLLFTSAQPPYELVQTAITVNPDPSISPNTFSSAFTNITTNPTYVCNQDNSSICGQEWQVVLTPTSGQCQILSSVTLSYNIVCRIGTLANCVQYTPNTFSITFTLLSDNFCAQVVDGGVIQGTLVPYQDSTFATRQSSFLLNQPVNFLASVSYSYGPTIISTVLDKIQIASASIVNLAPTDIGVSNFTMLPTSNPQQSIAFAITVTTQVITFANALPNPDQYQLVNVTVFLTVGYSIFNSVYKQQLQFTTQAASSQPQLSATIQVSSPTTSLSSTSSSNTSFVVPIAVGAACFVGVVALVVVLRRRHHAAVEKENEMAGVGDGNGSTTTNSVDGEAAQQQQSESKLLFL
jgi:hypothetical protein